MTHQTRKISPCSTHKPTQIQKKEKRQTKKPNLGHILHLNEMLLTKEIPLTT